MPGTRQVTELRIVRPESFRQSQSTPQDEENEAVRNVDSPDYLVIDSNVVNLNPKFTVYRVLYQVMFF